MTSADPIRGIWWLPDAPANQTVGDLTLSDDSQPILDLVGILKAPEHINERWSTPLIFGQPVKGQPVTLLACHETQLSLNGPGIITQRLAAFGGALVGIHLGSEDDEVFDRVVVEVEHLGELVGRTGLSAEAVTIDERVTGLAVRYDTPSTLVARVGTAEIHLAAGWRSGVPSTGSMTLSETWAFEIVLDKPTTLSLILGGWVERIRDLVSFCADRPCAVTSVRVGGPTTLVPSGAGHRLAEVHLPWIPSPTGNPKPLHHDEPVLLVPTDDEEFRTLMQKWVDVCDELEVVLDLHYASDYAGFVYGETRFINAAQAIEAYHRRRFARSPDELDISRRTIAIEACPETARSWLEEKLRYSHEPSLRRRIKDLVAFAGVTVSPFWKSAKERSNLVTRLVDTRNSLTHWDPASRVNLDGRELRALSAFLSLLLTACILRELGFTEEETSAALSRNRRYQFEVSQFADA